MLCCVDTRIVNLVIVYLLCIPEIYCFQRNTLRIIVKKTFIILCLEIIHLFLSLIWRYNLWKHMLVINNFRNFHSALDFNFDGSVILNHHHLHFFLRTQTRLVIYVHLIEFRSIHLPEYITWGICYKIKFHPQLEKCTKRIPYFSRMIAPPIIPKLSKIY